MAQVSAAYHHQADGLGLGLGFMVSACVHGCVCMQPPLDSTETYIVWYNAIVLYSSSGFKITRAHTLYLSMATTILIVIELEFSVIGDPIFERAMRRCS